MCVSKDVLCREGMSVFIYLGYCSLFFLLKTTTTNDTNVMLSEKEGQCCGNVCTLYISWQSPASSF